MSDMNVELYDALKKAGVSEDEARAAAIAVLKDNLSLRNQTFSLREDIAALKSHVETKMAMIFWIAGIAATFVFLGFVAPELRALLWPSEGF